MCSVGQRYFMVENYFVHRRCPQWMASNRLKLNPSKSEFLWCATAHRLHLVEHSALHLSDGDVTPASSMEKPGCILQRINGYVNPRQYAGKLVVLSTSTGSSNSTFDFDIYGNPTAQQLRDFQNRLSQVFLQAFQPVRWSAFSLFWTMQSELSMAGGSMTMWRHFWATNFTGCVFLTRWSSNVAYWYTRHCTDIHSTILHQRHGGPVALNTSFGNTQPSHPAEVKNKIRESFLFGCWSRGMELIARRY